MESTAASVAPNHGTDESSRAAESGAAHPPPALPAHAADPAHAAPSEHTVSRHSAVHGHDESVSVPPVVREATNDDLRAARQREDDLWRKLADVECQLRREQDKFAKIGGDLLAAEPMELELLSSVQKPLQAQQEKFSLLRELYRNTLRDISNLQRQLDDMNSEIQSLRTDVGKLQTHTAKLQARCEKLEEHVEVMDRRHEKTMTDLWSELTRSRGQTSTPEPVAATVEQKPEEDLLHAQEDGREAANLVAGVLANFTQSTMWDRMAPGNRRFRFLDSARDAIIKSRKRTKGAYSDAIAVLSKVAQKLDVLDWEDALEELMFSVKHARTMCNDVGHPTITLASVRDAMTKLDDIATRDSTDLVESMRNMCASLRAVYDEDDSLLDKDMSAYSDR